MIDGGYYSPAFFYAQQFAVFDKDLYQDLQIEQDDRG